MSTRPTNKYLILGCNRFQVRRFASRNGLRRSRYVHVKTYEHLYGYTNSVLIMLDGWEENMRDEPKREIIHRLMWWCTRNTIKTLSCTDGVIDFPSTIVKMVDEEDTTDES